MLEKIRKLLGSVREYRALSWLSPLLIAVEVLMECTIPLFTASMINTLEGLASNTSSATESIVGDINRFITSMAGGNALLAIVYHGLFLVLCATISLGAGAYAAKISAKASAGFAKNLRHDLFYKVQSFSFANVDKFSTSSLVTRLTTDVGNIQNAYMVIIRTAVRAPLMFVFSLVTTLKISKTMSLFQVGVVLVLAVLGGLLMGTVTPIFNRVFKKYDKLNESVQENVKAMRVVKAYVREDYEKGKFKKASDEVCRDLEKAEKIVALSNPLMMGMMYTIMLGVIFLGSLIAIGYFDPAPFGDSFGIGEITSLLSYSMQTLMSLMMLTMVLFMCSMAVESTKRVTEVLFEESTIKNPENPVTEVADGSVRFDNVSFKYSEKAEKFALSDIDLDIKSGETIGIIGGTGSSKTTLVQLICRLYDATEGTVYVGGRDVKDYDLETLRNEVAFVLQKNLLFSGTIAENLRWGNPNATDEEVRHAAKLAQADEFVMSFPDGYDTHIEQGGTNVSGGQKQRLCIARALLKNPKILILDDSTSAVDTRTDALIRQAFKTEIPNTTKFIIAQRIASVQDADKIIVMDGGKVVDFGPHEKLMATSEIYREVYTSQNRQGGDE